MNLPVSAAAEPDWLGLPAHPHFAAAFFIVTIVYVLVMFVLLIFFRKAMKKVPRGAKKPNRRKGREKPLRSTPHRPRPPESETGSDP